MSQGTQVLNRIWASAPSDEIYYEAVSLSHSTWPSTFYFTNQFTGFNAPLVAGGTDVEFKPAPFRFSQPKREQGSGDVTVGFNIANVDSVICGYVEMAVEKPEEPIKLRCFLFAELHLPDGPQNSPIELYLDNVVADNTAVSAQASRPDVINRAYPRGRYTRQVFPGLDR